MTTKPDTLGLLAALEAAIEQARALRPEPATTPAPCLCGSTDTRGRITTTPVDLTSDDVTVTRNEGQRQCRACAHGIHHGATNVTTHYSETSTVRDHYHPECVRL